MKSKIGVESVCRGARLVIVEVSEEVIKLNKNKT